MPSLRCLVSALTQAGGGDLLFRFASSVQSCCGEGGALQAEVAVCGELSPCSGQAACSFGGLSPGAARLFPPQRGARAARGLAPSPLAQFAFSLRGPSARRRSGLRKSLDRNQGLFAGWEGVASLGLSLPLSPPLPPTSSGDGAALLWSFSVPLFCEPPVVCSSRSIFLSLSHSLKKSPSDCSQGLLAGPYPKECRRLLSVPPPTLRSAPSCWWRVRASGVLFCWELLLGT